MPRGPSDLEEVVPTITSTMHTAPLDALASSIGLPTETLQKLCQHGKGPTIFKIGRRIYCRVADFHSWLDELAEGKIDGALTAKKKRAR